MSVPSHESQRACIHVLGLSIFRLSTIVLFDFGSVPIWFLIVFTSNKKCIKATCVRHNALFDLYGVQVSPMAAYSIILKFSGFLFDIENLQSVTLMLTPPVLLLVHDCSH